jgi:hypothetical protein
LIQGIKIKFGEFKIIFYLCSMENKLPTAEDFLPKNENGKYSRNEVETAMIEFAKLHVEAALKEAWSVEFNTLEEFNNCYPLTNIK